MSSKQANTVDLKFYLKHVKSHVCRKILDETEWDSFTEYELNCRDTDYFDCKITNGILDNHYPEDVNLDNFLVTPLSLHHLTHSFQDYLLDEFLNMSRIEYEVHHGKTNLLYVVVPYYEYWMQTEEKDSRNEVEQVNTIHNYFDYASQDEEDACHCDAHDFRCYGYKGTVPKTSTSLSDRFPEKEVKYSPKYEDVTVNKDHQINVDKFVSSKELDKPYSTTLSSFSYAVNPKTHKSYVLFRNKHSTTDTNQDGWVKYNDGYVFPREWKLIEGYRSVYFKNKVKGWVVGFSQRKQLDALGATFVE